MTAKIISVFLKTLTNKSLIFLMAFHSVEQKNREAKWAIPVGLKLDIEQSSGGGNAEKQNQSNNGNCNVDGRKHNSGNANALSGCENATNNRYDKS